MVSVFLEAALGHCQVPSLCVWALTSPSYYRFTLALLKLISAITKQREAAGSSEKQALQRRRQPGWHYGIASRLPEARQLRAARLASPRLASPRWLPGFGRCWGKPAAALTEEGGVQAGLERISGPGGCWGFPSLWVITTLALWKRALHPLPVPLCVIWMLWS